ncbi:putative ATP synthase F0, subunit B' [Crocosphaera subtropica ATCC 51142]|uniref:ATP synthase subunit b 2 n=1 Tax=Crocosphaera subtropica (strain ATCC 51142 / BH68) TaxID=43989 RepID=ATPF3_CROS5|nr:F0F1 ATP synthase subunit B [Crocosphaera subtropica]B1WXB2.1 RecName: Full=ATP synthase subunit b 2; AltName: Full=ATP synthase F(0) sector subunit b 2; AltName: Full=ATPase subunit I 2; AltName: Full=F-type ATPase subunit b 2; Short=F-ATPase subunit b 2 [Crocosphaera subtropica ATCC 51142]ACB50856.1 putative ATP synthase F0, subunit B' [Crocosphaera subtropica ATCC 51142]
MLIDWFTIVAQIINFLILVFLLNRFLYKPIVKTIKARQQEIENRWQDAEKEKKSAKNEANSYQKKQQELEEKKQEIMIQAQTKADEKYDNLVEEARQDVEQKRKTWDESLEREKAQFFDRFQEKIMQQIYKITGHVLGDLANASLEQQIINQFIHRLENLSEKERENLANSLNTTDNGLIIRSHFEISPESRNRLLSSLQQTHIYQGDNVQFMTNSDLICGIELQASDYKIAWNLKDYVEALEI